MKGTYIYKQNGIEIGRSENVITTDGKKSILQYLAGTNRDWASHMVIGSINTAATTSDQTLYYEVARSPINLKSFSSTSPNLIVKSTFEPYFAANIYEVGIYPASNSATFGVRNDLIINDFSSQSAWTDSGSAITGQWTEYLAQSPTSPRIGMYSLTVPSNKTYTNSSTYFDLRSYTTVDTLDLLLGPITTTSDPKNFTVKFTNSAGDYASLVYSLSANVNWQVKSLALTSDILNLKSISQIDITTASGLTVKIDAMKINIAAEVDETNSLVSRSIPTTPIAKIYGAPLEIEYYLDLQ